LVKFVIILFVVVTFIKNAYDKSANAVILPSITIIEFMIGKKNTTIIIIILNPVINDTRLILSENS
jgi:hypothetical protein